MAPTRIHFREELEQLEADALGGLDLVADLLERTVDALARHDAALASEVVELDDVVDARYSAVHDGLISLLARQTPVATDLRLVAALLHVAGHFERMGDQCVNVAKLVLAERREGPSGHEQMVERLVRMGRAARDQVLAAKRAFAERDVAAAEALVGTDDEIDSLNRECFRGALDLAADESSREWAMHMLLAARALERVGDNAVDVGEQLSFVVTGAYEEFEDASHPVANGT